MTEIVPAAEFEETLEDPMPRDYQKFRDGEGIPVHTGLYIEDVNEIEVDHWERTGQKGAFVNLYGTGGLDDLQVHELEPGGETDRIQHFYEEIVYVSDGHGMTVVGKGENKVTFEWQENSLFFLPQNTPYKHLNVSDDESARLFSNTSLPQYLTMIRDEEFIFNCDYNFWGKVGEDEYYSSEGGVYEGDEDATPGGGLVWEANLVSDVRAFERLEKWRNQAGGFVYLYMPNTNMFTHIGEFAAGTYKKGHRHYPGAQIVGLAGKGYTLLWQEQWDHKVRVDWGPKSIFVPPALWYHHHFPTSGEPARYLAMHPTEIGSLKHTVLNPAQDFNEIDYVDEDPQIRELYQEELKKRDLEFNMPDEAYTNPDYQW